MRTLLVADHNNSALSDSSRSALTAALELSFPVDILVAGHQCAKVAEEAARLSGVQRVLCVDDEASAHVLAERIVPLVLSLADRYDAFVAPATSFGKNVMPRLAARLDVMQVSDITAVVSPDAFKRPIFAGNVIQTVEVLTPKKVVTVRASAFAAAPRAEAAAPIEAVEFSFPPAGARFVGEEIKVSGRPELTSAKVIVSGGRGIGSADNFARLIEPLADLMGAGIGASRAAVDSGFAPNDWQVGQTGKIVAPDLYLAVGISGAIQHLAGMKDSKTIVAVNKDADAPIFNVADYGLVGDLFEVLPSLCAELQNKAA